MTKFYVSALTILALCAPASAELFTFEDVPTFTPIPFSATSGAITANFSSPQGSPFFTTPGPFSALTGNVLIDSDPAFNELQISFSQPLQALSLIFVLNANQFSDVLSLNAFLGGVAVGSASATGVVPGGFTFPEGTISFGGTAFDEVRLTSTAVDFGIDNIDVSASIPEPSSLWFAGAGVAALVARLAKRQIPS